KRYAAPQRAILKNEYWFGDGPPALGDQFTAALAEERSHQIIVILVRAAKRVKKKKNLPLARTYRALVRKLEKCRPQSRCGSTACTMCARAFQRAKTAAQERLILNMAKDGSGKLLAMVTLIPKKLEILPHELDELNIHHRNNGLKKLLKRAGFNRVI